MTASDPVCLNPDALREKVVVLAWFDCSCAACGRDAPKLQQLYAAHEGRLVVVGVNVDQRGRRQEDKVRRWVGKYGWTFPVILDAAAMQETLGTPPPPPAVVLIDRAGVVRRVKKGELLDADLEEIAAFARSPAT
jgi:peroxiredoxin